MKVYVVFSSDYMEGGEVDAIFSTKEKAEAFTVPLKKKNDAVRDTEVLEFEVDPE